MRSLGSSASTRCLVVEDQALIALDLEACLEDAGYEVVGPFPACDAAVASLGCYTPQVAVIDYRLRDGCCLELVRALRFWRVPFLVYSGLPRHPELNLEFAQVPWLEKPTNWFHLLQAVRKLARPEQRKQSFTGYPSVAAKLAAERVLVS